MKSINVNGLNVLENPICQLFNELVKKKHRELKIKKDGEFVSIWAASQLVLEDMRTIPPKDLIENSDTYKTIHQNKNDFGYEEHLKQANYHFKRDLEEMDGEYVYLLNLWKNSDEYKDYTYKEVFKGKKELIINQKKEHDNKN